MKERNFSDRHIIDEIRNRIDIVELIGETVSLKRAGSNFKGLCPFHNEKTPSFNVNAEKGLYKCFGCGKSGDIFSFLEETQGMTFAEALRELARRAGVSLPSFQKEDGNIRDEILSLNRIAKQFFSDYLFSKNGSEARAYLSKRGIDNSMIEKFNIGLSSPEWDVLYKKVSRSTSKEVIEKSGLFKLRESGGYYDAFRDRIIFPIEDIYGNTVAFGGREYRDEKGPKYINSPETPVYIKGKTLYALNLAKESIKRQTKAVLVEGYTDVILCHRYGFSNVVASLGTALTEEQVGVLSRLAQRVVLAYDPDSAGQKAAERGIDIALSRGLNVFVADMPEGKDPADFLLSEDALGFSTAIDKAEEFMQYRINSYLKKAETDIDKAKAAKSLASSLTNITDSILKSLYVKKIAEAFGISESSLLNASETDSKDESITKVVKGLDPELSILKIMIEDSGIRKRAMKELEPDDFSKEVRREVFKAICEADKNGEELKGDLGGRIRGIGLELLAHIAVAELISSDQEKLFDDYRRSMRIRKIDAEISNCNLMLQNQKINLKEKVLYTKKLVELLKEKGMTQQIKTTNERKAGDYPA